MQLGQIYSACTLKKNLPLAFFKPTRALKVGRESNLYLKTERGGDGMIEDVPT